MREYLKSKIGSGRSGIVMQVGIGVRKSEGGVGGACMGDVGDRVGEGESKEWILGRKRAEKRVGGEKGVDKWWKRG